MIDPLRVLCQVLYGRKEPASDWLGGSNAKIFIDAAESITTLRQQLADMEAAKEDAERKAESAIALVRMYGLTTELAIKALEDAK